MPSNVFGFHFIASNVLNSVRKPNSMFWYFRLQVPLPGRDDEGRKVILIRTGNLYITITFRLYKRLANTHTKATRWVAEWHSCAFPGINSLTQKSLPNVSRVPGAYDPKETPMSEVMKVGFITSDLLLLEEETQVHGVVILLDFSEFNSSHVWCWSRDTISKAMKCWQVWWNVPKIQFHKWGHR